MTKYLILFTCIFVANTLFAQETVNTDKQKAWIKKIYKKGQQLKRQERYDKALIQFDKILRKHPDYIKAISQKASIYYQINELEKAAITLEHAISIDSSLDASLYYSLGYIREQQGYRNAAIEAYKNYLDRTSVSEKNHENARKNIERLEFIIDAIENPVPFEPEDPGPAINTEEHEYLAALDVTGSFMVFTRRINHQEDLYYSFLKDGAWTDAKPIKDLNTPYNEGAHCLSPDGTQIFFTACENSISMGGCDLFVSSNITGKWSRPQNLGKQINSGSWDSQPAVSADGNTLYFTSTRPGGYGGKDIWFSRKDRSGTWSLAKNAGPNLNSPGNEESPFLHPDGKHLYFMSDGHTGMGGFDLFVSTLHEYDWSEPVNLGYPINTENDEGAIRVAADGQTAYFSSDRADISNFPAKNLNIFSFELPEPFRSQPVSYVEGFVRNSKSNEKLRVEYQLYDNNSGNWIRNGQTDIHGRFLIALPAGKNYNLNIDHPGFAFFSDNFNLSKAFTALKPFTIEVALIPLEKTDEWEKIVMEKEIVLKNVFFEFGSAVLDTVLSRVELQNLTHFLENNPNIKIQIEGHTDNIGDEAYNIALSLERAKAVEAYLIQRDISPSRIFCKGFGETRPIATNENPEGRKKNRRTSFKIIEQ